jgi:beta-phosphoglucomutase
MLDHDGGVIFDLDGVLVDTGWAHKQSWYDLAEKEGFGLSDEFFYRTFGMQNAQIIPMLLGRASSATKISRLSQWKEQRYRELIAEKLTLSEGMKKLLDDLHRAGFRMAIGSSAPRANLELILDHLSLRDYFSASVTHENVSRGKPAPDTFLKAADKLGLSPAHCVVVEDAVQGVEAGKAAGMAVVAVTTTRGRADLAQADVVVDDLSELRAEDFVKLLTKGSTS